MIAALVLSIPLLWVLFVVGIQYQRGGVWRVCLVAALPALVLNVLLNYSLLALISWDWPRKGEYTFSKRLERLVLAPGWRGLAAWAIATYLLDPVDPDGVHIKRKSPHG